MIITRLLFPRNLLFGIVLTAVCLAPAWAFAARVGPYDGQVLDGKNGAPVEGAAVLMFWLKVIPYPFQGGETIPCKTVLVRTDENGNYSVPAQQCGLGLSAFLESTHILIYKPGYIAYLEEEYHHDPDWENEPTKFKEKGNLVRLERIPPVFDHRRHVEQINWKLDRLEEYEAMNIGLLGKPKVKVTGAIPEKQEILSLIEWEIRRPPLQEHR